MQTHATQENADEKLHWVCELLNDHKAEDVVTIDVRSVSDIADVMIIATGTSSRHVKALSSHLVAACKQRQWPILSYEGQENSEWVLVDLGEIVVHVMQAETRAYYQLEKLWDIQTQTSEASG